MKKRFRLIITILLIVILAVIIFLPKINKSSGSVSSGPPARGSGGGMMGQGRQILNATGFVINPTELSEYINTTGTLRPDEEVELSFETSGKIVEINFTEGTRVRKGDLLAKINDRPLQAQLQKLQAQKKLAEEKEFRQRSLLDRDAISRESYDQIVTELQTIQADINLITARISETELRAPFDGIIGLRYLSEGSFANTSTKIARLVKNSPIKVEFSIPERYADRIRIGYPVSFVIDGSQVTYKADVYALDPKVDINTRTIILRALYPNRNEELKPGRFASITLLLEQIEGTMAIPSEALIPEMEGEIVYVYRNGRANRLRVTTGLRTAAEIQIVEGLIFGDTLLTSGILQLRHNLPVELDSVINRK
ncbi:MAG: efflux RND transporter periplasmic adaptor subunit [Bacteroidales bacterium]|nr:efflux RND transporter periplasmic adaptor subunit [Bacteroidales bacterium]